MEILQVSLCSEHTEAHSQDGLKKEENSVLSVDLSILQVN